ncbi:hypothetical protein C8J57DRAFT_1335698, partial [Mycena rebaudengoi]
FSAIGLFMPAVRAQRLLSQPGAPSLILLRVAAPAMDQDFQLILMQIQTSALGRFKRKPFRTVIESHCTAAFANPVHVL